MFGAQAPGSLFTPQSSLRWNGIEWSVLAVLFLVSCLVATAVVATNGNIFTGLGIVLTLGLVLLTLYRIEWSLFLLIALVLLFDQHRIPGFHSLTYTLRYFVNLKEHPYLPNLEVGVANLIELHIALLLLVWLVVYAAQRPADRKSVV